MPYPSLSAAFLLLLFRLALPLFAAFAYKLGSTFSTFSSSHLSNPLWILLTLFMYAWIIEKVQQLVYYFLVLGIFGKITNDNTCALINSAMISKLTPLNSLHFMLGLIITSLSVWWASTVYEYLLLFRMSRVLGKLVYDGFSIFVWVVIMGWCWVGVLRVGTRCAGGMFAYWRDYFLYFYIYYDYAHYLLNWLIDR